MTLLWNTEADSYDILPLILDIAGQTRDISLKRVFIMSFQVGSGYFSASISHNRIKTIADSDTPPEMSLWEKIKAFFCSTNKQEALDLIRLICHPPDNTNREKMIGRFERLRALAYDGFADNVQTGRNGGNYACILDENRQEMLSVTFDDTGNYAVKYPGHSTHHFIPRWIMVHDEYTIRESARDYEIIWSAWQKAAPESESDHRADAVKKMRDCLDNGKRTLNLNKLFLTSLPDHLPPDITTLSLNDMPLYELPELPDTLQRLHCNNNQLTYLPELPKALRSLQCNDNQLSHLPPLPKALRSLKCNDNQLTRLPELPDTLQLLHCNNNQLTYLPELPKALCSLKCNDNQLTSLPPLPDRLQEMLCRNNQLTRLPALPADLNVLLCPNNRLTSLPKGITDLSGEAHVNMLNNCLSEHEQQATEAMSNDPGYRGPRIYVRATDSFTVPGDPSSPATSDPQMPEKQDEPESAQTEESLN